MPTQGPFSILFQPSTSRNTSKRAKLTCQQYSQIREVPDHQEVYLDTNGYSSIVVEILEYQEKGSDEEALQYHFADLIDEEDSTNILEQGRAVMEKLR